MFSRCHLAHDNRSIHRKLRARATTLYVLSFCNVIMQFRSNLGGALSILVTAHRHLSSYYSKLLKISTVVQGA